MVDIYEQIWSEPCGHVSVSGRNENGEWADPNADILLEEQGKPSGCTSADAQPQPLIGKVNPEVLAKPTVQTFLGLLDNYTAEEHKPERDLSDPVQAAEIESFLDAVFVTPTFRLAVDYAASSLVPTLSEDEFRNKVRALWFEPYTNRFGGADPFAVGFEHVFVGEDSSTGSPPWDNCRDRVGGYHSWIKYFIDQQAGKVTYLGHDYRNSVAQSGLNETTVATVMMTWNPDVAEGGRGFELQKSPGGFFVGTLPEVEMAIGSIGLLELLPDQQQDRFEIWNQKDEHRVQFGDALFDLVLHPETVRLEPTKELGTHLRTLFPKYRGPANGGGGGNGGGGSNGGGSGGGGGIGIPTQNQNSGPVQITAARPNPEGDDSLGGEWVELLNATDETIDLANWTLADQENRRQSLTGTLQPGERRIIDLIRADSSSMQLRNSGGWILLFLGTLRIAAVRYRSSGQGEVVNFD